MEELLENFLLISLGMGFTTVLAQIIHRARTIIDILDRILIKGIDWL
jgi:hypothetical protein